MTLQDLYGFVAQLWVVWLLLLFVGIVVWVFLPRNRRRMKDHAEIPFRNDDDSKNAEER